MSVNEVTTTEIFVDEDTSLTSGSAAANDITTMDTFHNYEFEYTHYMYPGYTFERLVYSYVWTCVVVLMSLVNIVVVYILLHRKIRNPTYMVLAAIALSDLLTGLTTLPTYVMVYQSTELPEYDEYPSMYPYSYDDMPSYMFGGQADYSNYSTYAHYNYSIHGNDSGSFSDVLDYEGYHLTKELCRWFMVTKFFISKTFHSISIYLTLFLGICRFISVTSQFKTKALTSQRAILVCIITTVLSPLLHVYHLIDERAERGMCEWTLDEKGCVGGCIHLWVMFVLRCLIPVGVLLVLTMFMIRALHNNPVRVLQADSNQEEHNTTGIQNEVENRRIAVIVTAIGVIFLIPEIPYGFYLLYNAIDKTVNDGVNMDLETNRAIHMTYEILLVLSFHAKFYIYILFNRTFRKILVQLFVQPVRRIMGNKRRVSTNTSGSQRIGSTV